MPKPLAAARAALELANPISSDMSSMRPNLLPGLVAAARRNRDRGFGDAAFFEIGQAYRGDAPEDQYNAASGVRSGTARPAGAGRHWSGTSGNADLFDAKADALSVLGAFGFTEDRLQVTRSVPEWFHPGRSGALQLGPKNTLAHFGEVHPAILERFGIEGEMAAFEVFLDAPPEPKRSARTRSALDITDLQTVRRDFAFLVPEDVAAGDLLRAARGADKALISTVTLFDVFTGKGVPDGQKSLAIEVTLSPREKTLTDAEIEAVAEKVVAAVQKATGGELRG